jgi:hypothetical protein
MIDPLGRILTEIRDDAAVAALTTRIRGGEPMATGDPSNHDAQGAGSYRRFVVLVRIGRTRLPRAPIQEVRIAARCYGLTYQDAAALAGVVSDAVHARGHRITPANAVIFGSFEDGGGEAVKDPVTDQPYETVVISVGALTEALPIA